MKKPVNYIATWFYKESANEKSYYPQIGQNGNSALAQSIYMQIQIPFFITFRHYNPYAEFLFFTNLKKEELPDFLLEMFCKLDIKVITLQYTCRPPKGWYASWQNQFYLYDILKWAETELNDEDTIMICDADCLCNSSIEELFGLAYKDGAALYEIITNREHNINGITLPEMNILYNDCYKEKPQQDITYYGGELMVFRNDIIKRINKEFSLLWQFNLDYAKRSKFKLNEEAHVMSIIAEVLKIRNNHANKFVKRMWTNPQFNNIQPCDVDLPIWHLPYEKKRGLYRLYKYLIKNNLEITDETIFWNKAQKDTGIPVVSKIKRIKDFITTIYMKFK